MVDLGIPMFSPSTLAVTKALTEQDKAALEQCFATPEAKKVVETLYQASHGRPVKAEADAGRREARSGCPCWQSGLTASLSYSRKAIFSTRLGGFRSVTPACQRAIFHRSISAVPRANST